MCSSSPPFPGDDVEKTTHNALRLMTLWNSRSRWQPVPAGRWPGHWSMANTHGESGMDGFAFEEVTAHSGEAPRGGGHAPGAGAQRGKGDAGAHGPLTNLALLSSEVEEKIEEIVLMGGAFLRGDLTPVAEFNIYVDPRRRTSCSLPACPL